MSVIAPLLIDPPPPPVRPYGLFDVALGPMPFPDEHVGNYGLIYVPDACQGDIFLYANDCPAVSGSKTFSPIDTPVTGTAFTVITSYTCGSIGYSFAEAEQRVRTRMALREQRAIEKRVWQGQLGGGSVLGNINGLFRGATNLGTAGCPTVGLQMLEQALADNAVVGGLIHARPGMSSHLTNKYAIYEGPGRIKRTVLGTPYSFGAGYDGSGPAGEAATTGTEWMYASGRVAIWQDPEVNVPPVAQTFDRTNNQVKVLAERGYVVTVECGVWAVNVTRDCTTA